MTAYKQTELGLIPSDWEIRKIGDFTDCTAGGTPSTQISAYWGGEIPWMSSGELHLKRVYDVVGRITQLGLNNSSTKFIPENSVLVGLAGQGKTRGTVAISKIPLCTNQSIASIFPNEQFCPEFLFYNLENRYDELRSLSTGDGGRGGLNLTIIRNIWLKFPTKPEQTAIATALSDTDALLAELEKLLAKKHAIKTATMQQLLTGKTRLPEFAHRADGTPKGSLKTEWGDIPEDWEVMALGDLLNYEQPIRYIIQNNEILEKGSIPVLTAGKSFILGYTEEEFNCYKNYPVIIFDDFTTDSKFVDFSFKVKSSAMKMLKPKNTNTPILLIFYLLKNIKFIVGDHKRHWISEFQHLKVKLPKSTTEQTAIAQILGDMDSEITALQARIEKLREIKQGMMQNLLTGKIRLPF
jgi:hypothetical protein